MHLEFPDLEGMGREAMVVPIVTGPVKLVWNRYDLLMGRLKCV
jgi:hypothetical protein